MFLCCIKITKYCVYSVHLCSRCILYVAIKEKTGVSVNLLKLVKSIKLLYIYILKRRNNTFRVFVKIYCG